MVILFFFFFQAEDGIRDSSVTGVQTCALPICPSGDSSGQGGAADPEARPGPRHRGGEEALSRDRGKPDRRSDPPRCAVLRSADLPALGRVDEPLRARSGPSLPDGRLRRRGMDRLKGKVAVVTGGASGIGKAIALRLAGDGASIVIADLQKYDEAAAAIAKATGCKTLGLRTDVSNETDVSSLAAQTMTAFGRLDILVNNAAVFSSLELRPFQDIPIEEFRRVMEVNILGVWLCCRACVPHMRRGGYGRIVNLASGAPLKGVPLFLHYISSKGAVI